MNTLSQWIKLAILAVAVVPATAVYAQESEPTALRLDQETQVGSASVACTGIGQAKHDPRWNEYPLRIEFANDKREILIGALVTVSDDAGTTLFSVACGGAWLLVKLDAGAYKVNVRIADSDAPEQSRIIEVPSSGQTRETFVFPGL